jgi:outer membrane receptor protein involved in Fe transport
MRNARRRLGPGLGLALTAALAAPRALRAQAPDDAPAAASQVATRVGLLEEASPVRVLSRREIDAMPGRSVADVLRTLPGLDVTRGGREGASSAVSLDGAGAEGTLVLVDGEPVSDPASGAFSLDLEMPLDGVERIEVLDGSAAAVYGPGAIGGAINIVTRGAELGRSNVQCETRYVHGSRSLDAGTYRGAGRLGRATAIGFEIGRTESGGDGNDTDLSLETAHVAAKIETAVGRVALTAGYVGRDFGAPGVFGAGADARETTRTRALRASLASELGGWEIASSVSVRAHHDLFSDAPVAAPVATAETGSDTDTFRARLSARNDLLGGRLVVGAEAFRDAYASGTVSVHRDSGALFLEYGRAFDVESPRRGGVRFALRGETDEGFSSRLTPSLAVVWSPAAGLRLHASAGLGYRLPTFEELYGADVRGLGDPRLGAETSRDLDLGASLDSGPLTLEANGFVRSGRHVLDRGRDGGDGPYRFVAYDTLDTRGASGSLSFLRSLPAFLSRVSLEASALSLSAPEGPATPGGLRDALRVKLDAKVSAGLPNARLRAFTRVGWLARRLSGGAVTQDVRLGWQTLEGDIFEIYLEAENLWDRRIEELPGLPPDGRRLLAGFHLTW